VDEVETAALKQGRKVCSKLEAKIKELEAELDQEQRRLTDTTKSLRKSERRIKELEFQVIYMKQDILFVSITPEPIFLDDLCPLPQVYLTKHPRAPQGGAFSYF
jgi:hypothetical protein